MIKIYTSFLSIILTFTFLSSAAQTDVTLDTVLAKKLILNQEHTDKKFIAFLKAKKIDSCMAYLPENVFTRFPKERLKTELNHIAELFIKYPNLKNSSPTGSSVVA